MSEKLHWEPLTEPDDMDNARAMLAGHVAVRAWYGEGEPNVQYNMLVTGLSVPDLPAPVHAVFWTSDTRHYRVLESKIQQSGYAATSFGYHEPRNMSVRGLTLRGKTRNVKVEELPGFLAVWNDQRRADRKRLQDPRIVEYSLSDFAPDAPRTRQSDIGKHLYVTGFDWAGLTASWLNEEGSRRKQDHMPIDLTQLVTDFVEHPPYPDLHSFPGLRFSR